MKEQGWKGTNISKILIVIKLRLDPKLHWEEKQSFHSEQETNPLIFCEVPLAQYFSVQIPELWASFPPVTTCKLGVLDFTKESIFFAITCVLFTEFTLRLLRSLLIFVCLFGFGWLLCFLLLFWFVFEEGSIWETSQREASKFYVMKAADFLQACGQIWQ